MADEYVEVEMSDIENTVDSSPPPSDYDPSSDNYDSINILSIFNVKAYLYISCV